MAETTLLKRHCNCSQFIINFLYMLSLKKRLNERNRLFVLDGKEAERINFHEDKLANIGKNLHCKERKQKNVHIQVCYCLREKPRHLTKEVRTN